MSASWEVASATQTSHSGAAETGTLATQVADHIGGSFARLPPAPTTLCYLGLSATRAIGLLSVAPRRLADQGGEGPP